jgi:hypothetical protein
MRWGFCATLKIRRKMMRQTRGWNGLRTAVVALGIAASAASGADAAALMTYSTVGSTIDSAGVTGTGAISFNTVDSGSFSNPSSFSLGDFQVAELPEGTSTTYVNTPFSITFQSKLIDGVEPIPNATPIVIKGTLNGTVNGGDQSTVVASFDPASDIPVFQTGLYYNTLSIPDLNLSLVPSTSNGGRTTAQAYLVASTDAPPVPEPTTIALFLTTLAGLGIRHRIRAGRVS